VVDDAATGLLMEQFYTRLLDGKGKADALRLAQQYIRDYGDGECARFRQRGGTARDAPRTYGTLPDLTLLSSSCRRLGASSGRPARGIGRGGIEPHLSDHGC
jgi:hypothetical protein